MITILASEGLDVATAAWSRITNDGSWRRHGVLLRYTAPELEGQHWGAVGSDMAKCVSYDYQRSNYADEAVLPAVDRIRPLLSSQFGFCYAVIDKWRCQ